MRAILIIRQMRLFLFILVCMLSLIIILIYILLDAKNGSNLELINVSMPKDYISKEQREFNEFLNKTRHRIHLKLPSLFPAHDENNSFTFNRINCTPILMVYGERNTFGFCFPPKKEWNGPNKSAYIVGGQRDKLFESNLKKNVGNNLKVKVFTKIHDCGFKELVNANNLNEFPNLTLFEPDLIQNIHVESFVYNFVENGPIGIKDLIDIQNDGFEIDIEAMKCEMTKKTNPLIWTAMVTEVAHLLVRVEGFDYNELRYLIKRLNSAAYYPYFIYNQNTTYFFSFMNKYAFVKYQVTDHWADIWKRY